MGIEYKEKILNCSAIQKPGIVLMEKIYKHSSKTYKKLSVLGWRVHLFPRAMAKAGEKMKIYPGLLLKGFNYLSMLHRFTHVLLTCQRIKIFGNQMICQGHWSFLSIIMGQFRRRIK